MCPACIATVTVVAAGAGSTGGLAAVVARLLGRKRRLAKQTQTQGADK